MEFKTKTVYGLVDPRDQTIRYVGVTVHRLEQRLNGHWSDSWIRKHGSALGSNIKRIAWINELRALQMKPSIKALESVPVEDDKAEQRWIRKLTREGHSITNKLHGIGNPTARKPITRSVVDKAIERLHAHGEHTLADLLEDELYRPW